MVTFLYLLSRVSDDSFVRIPSIFTPTQNGASKVKSKNHVRVANNRRRYENPTTHKKRGNGGRSGLSIVESSFYDKILTSIFIGTYRV